jgi:hypothetical protein
LRHPALYEIASPVESFDDLLRAQAERLRRRLIRGRRAKLAATQVGALRRVFELRGLLMMVLFERVPLGPPGGEDQRHRLDGEVATLDEPFVVLLGEQRAGGMGRSAGRQSNCADERR